MDVFYGYAVLVRECLKPGAFIFPSEHDFGIMPACLVKGKSEPVFLFI